MPTNHHATRRPIIQCGNTKHLNRPVQAVYIHRWPGGSAASDEVAGGYARNPARIVERNRRFIGYGYRHRR